MSDDEERKEYRKKQDRILLAVCGDEALGIKGFVQKQEDHAAQLKSYAENTDGKLEIMNDKLDRDHTLLTPNRGLFYILKTLRKPAVLIIFFLIVASLLGINYADAIRIFIEGIL